MTYRKAITFATVVVMIAALSGCARGWGGEYAEKIDAAVASSGLLDMGEVVCDSKRPSQLWGGSTLRLIGLADSSNGQNVVNQLEDAGFVAKGPADDLSDGYISLYKDRVNFFVSTESEAGRSYAFGECTTPENGAVSIEISA